MMRLVDIFKPKKSKKVERQSKIPRKKNIDIMIGQPAKWPQVLIEHLIPYCKKNNFIEAVYLAQIYVPSSGEKPHLLIGVTMPIIETKKIFDEIGNIVENTLDKNDFVDIIKIDDDDLSVSLIEENNPIYKKC